MIIQRPLPYFTEPVLPQIYSLVKEFLQGYLIAGDLLKGRLMEAHGAEYRHFRMKPSELTQSTEHASVILQGEFRGSPGY